MHLLGNWNRPQWLSLPLSILPKLVGSERACFHRRNPTLHSSFVVGGLYVFHSWLACTCVTTYEFMRSDRIDYLRGTRDFDLPYSRGLGNNLKFFFFKDGLLHIIFNHKWKPQNWKLPGKIVRDSEEWWDNLWENKYWSCC